MIKPIIPKMDPITVAVIESHNVTKKQDNNEAPMVRGLTADKFTKHNNTLYA